LQVDFFILPEVIITSSNGSPKRLFEAAEEPTYFCKVNCSHIQPPFMLALTTVRKDKQIFNLTNPYLAYCRIVIFHSVKIFFTSTLIFETSTVTKMHLSD